MSTARWRRNENLQVLYLPFVRAHQEYSARRRVFVVQFLLRDDETRTAKVKGVFQMKLSDSGESPIRNNPSALVLFVLLAFILAASAVGILTWALGWGVLLLFGAAFVIFFIASFALDAVRGAHKPR